MLKTFSTGTLNITTNGSQINLQPSFPSGPAAGVLDLSDDHNRGDIASVEIEIDSNGTAPNTGAKLTAYFATASRTDYTPAQLRDGAAAVANLDLSGMGTNDKRVLVMPSVLVNAQYCYVFFDNAAMASGAQLVISARVNIKRS